MRNLLFIFVIIIFYTCSSEKEHSNFRYAKSKFILKHPTLLRTDGVYLRTTTGVDYNHDTFIGYSFYRFYENGRCYESKWKEGLPNDSILVATNKKNGQRTFFRNNGNNITIESWGGNYVRYVYEYATVDSSSLTINAYKPRGFGASKHSLKEKYEFKKLNLLDKANW